MTKGTIIYWGGFELPDKNAAAHRVVANGKILKSLDYQVVYLGTAVVNEDEYFNGIRQSAYSELIYEEAHPLTIKQWARWFFSVSNLRAVTEKYDDIKMIIVYNVPYVILKRVKAEYSKKGIKVVYDCTEWSGETKGALPKRILKKADEYFVRTRIGAVSDGLIVISRMMQEAYQKNRNVLLLPPLVDLNDPIWHQSVEERTDGFEFCFAGVPGGNKESLDKVIEAFCQLEDEKVSLRIIGPSQEDVLALDPQIETLLLDKKDKIIFMGRLSHQDTIKHVLGCDCYIFIRPSNRRNNAGFPTKFAESFTCGGRIITTDVSDVAPYLEKADRGSILTTTDVDAIKHAMQTEMANKDAIGRKKLDETFHYESYIVDCKEWIEELFKEDGREYHVF